MAEHQVSCPRLQFWDAGEFEAPCTCKEETMKTYTVTWVECIKAQAVVEARSHKGAIEKASQIDSPDYFEDFQRSAYKSVLLENGHETQGITRDALEAKP